MRRFLCLRFMNFLIEPYRGILYSTTVQSKFSDCFKILRDLIYMTSNETHPHWEGWSLKGSVVGQVVGFCIMVSF